MEELVDANSFEYTSEPEPAPDGTHPYNLRIDMYTYESTSCVFIAIVMEKQRFAGRAACAVARGEAEARGATCPGSRVKGEARGATCPRVKGESRGATYPVARGKGEARGAAHSGEIFAPGGGPPVISFGETKKM